MTLSRDTFGLNTQINSTEEKNIPYTYTFSRDTSKSGEYYKASIHIDSPTGKIELGTISFTIRNNKEFPYTEKAIFQNASETDFTYVHIDSSFYKDSKKYFGVEMALFEIVFKVSLANKCEGRVNFEASRYLHQFYFEQGFRHLDVLAKTYYLTLAQALITNHQVNFNCILYLPRSSIQNKIMQWNIDYSLSEFETESENNRKRIEKNERIIQEAHEFPMITQVIIALSDLNYGWKNDEPKGFKKKKEYQVTNPSLYCSTTKYMIETACEWIEKNRPFITLKKREAVAEILVGMMIATLTYQDNKYGIQARYDNKFLCPDLKFDALFNEQEETDSQFQRVGKQALCGQLPFEAKIHLKFFPLLAAIPGLEHFLQLCQSQDRTENFEKEIAKIFAPLPQANKDSKSLEEKTQNSFPMTKLDLFKLERVNFQVIESNSMAYQTVCKEDFMLPDLVQTPPDSFLQRARNYLLPPVAPHKKEIVEETLNIRLGHSLERK